jgi:S-adenosylmethionine synthetase
MSYQVFTSESVCAGHPDKLCDQISDSIVDAVLTQDPLARIAVETAVTKDHVMLFGEITTTATVDYAGVARHEIKRLGYTKPKWGFSHESRIDVMFGSQSVEIARGVDHAGAGDQGMMFGYACRETPTFMPLPITLAHRLTKRLDTARQSRQLPYLLPDGKAQVTIRYDQGRPISADQVTIATPHSSNVAIEQVRHDVYEQVIAPALAESDLELKETDIIVNGTGVWHLPGPASDAGLTGRKIVVDGYGGYARVGGGAFSGKDPTKVDRSGAYAARYIAKNLVMADLTERAEVALAYYIGAKKPVMQAIETFGTSHVSPAALKSYVDKLLDTSVEGIIEAFDLRRPIFHATAAYGHFGRPEFPWEQISTDL